jgi:hypothetical protein
MDGQASIPDRGKIFLFSTASRPALRPTLSYIKWVLEVNSPGVKWDESVKLTTHLHVVPRSRMMKLYLHSHICLHGIVLNELSTGTTPPTLIMINNE